MKRSMPDGGYHRGMDVVLALGALGLVMAVVAIVFGVEALTRWAR
jgi:hypothetical protein